VIGILGWSLAILGAVAPVEANPEWLQWDAVASCPDAEFAKRATELRLGREATASDATVVATIERHDDEHRLELQITRDATLDVHHLTSQDCRTLAEATGLLIAVSVDPVATARALPPVSLAAELPVSLAGPELPEPSLDAETAPAEPIRSPVPRAPVQDTDSEPVGFEPGRVQDVRLGVSGGAELGALPGLSGGPRLQLGLGWERWRLELGGSLYVPRTARTENGAARVGLATADVQACWRLGGSDIEVPVCGGIEAGASFAQGLRDPGARSASGLWVAPRVSGGVHGWVLSNLALVARAEVAVSAVRTAYEVRDPGDPITVFAPGPVSGRLWLGLEVKIWSRS